MWELMSSKGKPKIRLEEFLTDQNNQNDRLDGFCSGKFILILPVLSQRALNNKKQVKRRSQKCFTPRSRKNSCSDQNSPAPGTVGKDARQDLIRRFHEEWQTNIDRIINEKLVQEELQRLLYESSHGSNQLRGFSSECLLTKRPSNINPKQEVVCLMNFGLCSGWDRESQINSSAMVTRSRSRAAKNSDSKKRKRGQVNKNKDDSDDNFYRADRSNKRMMNIVKIGHQLQRGLKILIQNEENMTEEEASKSVLLNMKSSGSTFSCRSASPDYSSSSDGDDSEASCSSSSSCSSGTAVKNESAKSAPEKVIQKRSDVSSRQKREGNDKLKSRKFLKCSFPNCPAYIPNMKLGGVKSKSMKMEDSELEVPMLENSELEGTEMEVAELEGMELKSMELENIKLENVEVEGDNLENEILASEKGNIIPSPMHCHESGSGENGGIGSSGTKVSLSQNPPTARKGRQWYNHAAYYFS